LYRKSRLVKTIPSAQGVRQGDSLAALAFAVSVQGVYERALRGTQAAGVAILDDLVIFGRAPAVFQAIDQLKQACKEEKIQINLGKSRVLFPGPGAPPRNLVTQCHTNGIPLVRGSMQVLGSRIGCDRDADQKWGDDLVAAHKPFFSALAKVPYQYALLLLRSCGLPCLNYVTRTVPPSNISKSIAEFDRLVLMSLGRIVEKDPAKFSEEVKQQIGLPLRHGGLGLRPYARVAPAAFLASFNSAVDDVLNIVFAPAFTVLSASLGTIRLRHVPSSAIAPFTPFQQLLATPRAKEAQDCHQGLTRGGVSVIPFNAFLRLHKQHLQKDIVASIDELRSNNLKRRGDATAARLLSAASKHASSWLSTLPTSDAVTITDGYFPHAIRNLLGLSPNDSPSGSCFCGQPFSITHPHSCTPLKRRAITVRHDAIVQCLASLAREVGYSVTVEPTDPVQSHSKRPDLLILNSSRSFMLDVSVVEPTAPTYLPMARTTAGSAAHRRERDKHAKYDAIANAEHCSFQPFIMEVYGTLGTQARNMVKTLAKQASILHVDSENRFIKRAMSMLMTVLQIGNARVLDEGLLAMKRHQFRSAVTGSDE
jgi:hypothetical protein